MCGFVGIFGMKDSSVDWRTKALKMSSKIRHRGPDWSGIFAGETCILAHERLAIVDPLSGGQPLYSPDGKCVLAVNGEIYNHQDIRKKLAGQYDFRTGSDCEVILALYQKKGIDFLEDLNGIYAFALYDSEKDALLVARDPIGVIPLYIGHDPDGTIYVASELKALEGFCTEYEPFLPGHYYWSPDGKMLYSVQAQSPFKTPPENLGQDPKMERPPEEAAELATNLHYRVVRRAFDPMARTFGPPEKVMADPMNRHSFTHPRISPDGRWLVVTCAPRGVFPIQQWQADLWMLDLKRRVVRPLVELNSAESDSYHNFDSSGRWFMFTSRRDDGSYTRLYFAAFDPEKGVFSKPFMLPQRRPLDNLRRFKSYNVPEFAR